MFDPRYITTRRVRPIALILRKLGLAAFGPGAGELMGKVQVAILAGALYTLLRDAVFAPVRSRSRFSRSRHSSRLGKENGIVSKHLTFQRRKTKAEEKYGSRVDPPSREASTFA